MSETPSNQPEIQPRITVLSNQEVLSTADLGPDTELVVGRSPQSHIVLSIGTVSRMHARFFHDENGVFLEDLGSANGSFVDGQKVEGVVQLRSGQLIRLGQSHSTGPTMLRIDLAPRVPDVGKTRPVTALQPPASPGPSGSTSRPKADDDTDDDLTLPGLEPTPKPPTDSKVSPLRTRPLRLAPPAPTRSRPASLWIGLGCLLLFGLFVVWHSCREVDPWRRVAVEPDLLEAGRPLQVTGMAPGFEFGFDLFVGGQNLEDLRVTGTTGAAIVPNLPALPPGDHRVSVLGVADDQEVFELTLPYRKAPRIDNIVPTAGHLGERIVLTGGSLGDPENPPELYVGSYAVEPESMTGNEIAFRIPRVTETPPVELPVRVSVGGLDALAPTPLTVSSHRFEPIDLGWKAQRQAEADLWEISSILGPTLYLQSQDQDTAPDEASLPPNVETAIRGLERLFRWSAEGRDVEVTVAASKGRYSYGVTGRQGNPPEALFDLSTAEVDELSHRRQTETDTELRANWLARVLTDISRAVAAGQPPPEEPSDAAHLQALKRLIATNLERGGSGRPGLPDLERLSVTERQALERAFVAVPPSLEPLTGRWIGQLENIFEAGAGQLEVVFVLTQRGRRLSGTAEVAFRSRAGSQGFPEATVSGSITSDVPRLLTLELEVNRPIGKLRFEGKTSGEGLVGTYTSNLSTGGSWTAAPR